MMPPRRMASGLNLLLSILIAALCYGGLVRGDRNCTVFSSNSSIQYQGQWGMQQSSFAAGGQHAFSEDRNASASFNFTGVAIYYTAPLWPYTVNTLLTLDSEPPVVVDLTGSQNGTVGESEDEPARVLWSKLGLPNTTHTLVASMWDNGSYVVVDSFIWTILDSPLVNSTALNSTSPTAPAAVTVVYNFTKMLDDALIGIICAILVIVVAGVIFFFVSRHRRKQRHRQSAAAAATMSSGNRPSVSSSSESLPSRFSVQIINLRKQASVITLSTQENHRS